jgi:hypothetical protein
MLQHARSEEQRCMAPRQRQKPTAQPPSQQSESTEQASLPFAQGPWRGLEPFDALDDGDAEHAVAIAMTIHAAPKRRAHSTGYAVAPIAGSMIRAFPRGCAGWAIGSDR